MKPRFSFPGDEILKHAESLTLKIRRQGNGLALTYHLVGWCGFRDLVDENAEAPALLPETGPDVLAMATQLIQAMERPKGR